ncbi:unnamed protein product [Phytophthora lilii]|uniref:Unnamed protein product n=1 Tax=Phytophthora lilii TaxID=2077276 RepID=A0A9W6TV43_9STRA|nr:unnamed protein product [Phytophthora lilii]
MPNSIGSQDAKASMEALQSNQTVTRYNEWKLWISTASYSRNLGVYSNSMSCTPTGSNNRVYSAPGPNTWMESQLRDLDSVWGIRNIQCAWIPCSTSKCSLRTFEAKDLISICWNRMWNNIGNDEYCYFVDISDTLWHQYCCYRVPTFSRFTFSNVNTKCKRIRYGYDPPQ